MFQIWMFRYGCNVYIYVLDCNVVMFRSRILFNFSRFNRPQSLVDDINRLSCREVFRCFFPEVCRFLQEEMIDKTVQQLARRWHLQPLTVAPTLSLSGWDGKCFLDGEVRAAVVENPSFSFNVSMERATKHLLARYSAALLLLRWRKSLVWCSPTTFTDCPAERFFRASLTECTIDVIFRSFLQWITPPFVST